MGKTIGIVSLKGGVGKTSVVAALGATLANFNKKVLLVDGDLSTPSLGVHLDIINPEFTLHDVLLGSANLRDAIHAFENFDVIPSSIFNKNKINPFKLRDKIKSVKKSYDVILIDSSPSMREDTLAVLLASDEVFVVTTPDYPTLAMTLKAVDLAKRRGTPISGLILNKVYNKNFELSLDDIEKTSDVPVMAVLPYDIDVIKALSDFTPSTIYKPKSEGSEECKKLAAAILGEKYKPIKMRKFFRFVSPKKQELNRTAFYDRVFKE